MRTILLLTATAALAGCAAPPLAESPPAARARWSARYVPGLAVSLRGLSVVDADVVWASGEHGTVVVSRDGGRSFSTRTVAAAGGADLRSLHAFDADVAVAATAGAPARILRTDDGGATWEIVHELLDAGAFLDSVRFADRERGWAFGDPLGGRHCVLTSDDGGCSWQRVARPPAPIAGEAGFAASNACIDARGDLVRIGTGGTRARVLLGRAAGAHWTAVPVPLQQGTASQGVFALAFADLRRGVAVGGDHRDPARRDGTAAFTSDGGLSWSPAARPPRGYRSGASFAPGFGDGVVFAVGPDGADVSADAGRTWAPVPGGAARGHHAIAFAADAAVGWAVGAGGRITRIDAVRRR